MLYFCRCAESVSVDILLVCFFIIIIITIIIIIVIVIIITGATILARAASRVMKISRCCQRGSMIWNSLHIIIVIVIINDSIIQWFVIIIIIIVSLYHYYHHHNHCNALYPRLRTSALTVSAMVHRAETAPSPVPSPVLKIILYIKTQIEIHTSMESQYLDL